MKNRLKRLMAAVLCAAMLVSTLPASALATVLDSDQALEQTVDGVETPVEESTPPVEESQASTEESEAPTEESEAPTEESEAPTEESEASAEESEAPTEESEAPTEESETPAEESEAPTEESETPTEESDAPTEESEAPAEESTPPVEESEAPTEESETPTEEDETPTEGETPTEEPSETPAVDDTTSSSPEEGDLGLLGTGETPTELEQDPDDVPVEVFATYTQGSDLKIGSDGYPTGKIVVSNAPDEGFNVTVTFLLNITVSLPAPYNMDWNDYTQGFNSGDNTSLNHNSSGVSTQAMFPMLQYKLELPGGTTSIDFSDHSPTDSKGSGLTAGAIATYINNTYGTSLTAADISGKVHAIVYDSTNANTKLLDVALDIPTGTSTPAANLELTSDSVNSYTSSGSGNFTITLTNTVANSTATITSATLVVSSGTIDTSVDVSAAWVGDTISGGANGDTLTIPFSGVTNTTPAIGVIEVTYEDGAGDTKTLTIDLRAVWNASQANLVPSPASMSFSATGTPQTETLTNTGTRPAYISNIEASTGFTVTYASTPTFPFSVAGGSSEPFYIEADGTASSGTVKVTWGGGTGGTGSMITIPVTYTAPIPTYTVEVQTYVDKTSSVVTQGATARRTNVDSVILYPTGYTTGGTTLTTSSTGTYTATLNAGVYDVWTNGFKAGTVDISNGSATFKAALYTVSVAASGATPSTLFIKSSGTTSVVAPLGTTLTIRTNTPAGYTFDGWTVTGDSQLTITSSGSNNTSVSLPSDLTLMTSTAVNATAQTVTANFTSNATYDATLTIKKDDVPWDSVNVTLYDSAGTSVVQGPTATDASGQVTFTGLAAGTYNVLVDGEFNSTMKEITVSAAHTETINYYTLKVVTADGTTNQGTVMFQGGTGVAEASRIYLMDQSPTGRIVATAQSGYSFDKWVKSTDSSELSGSTQNLASLSLTMNTPITYTAHFTADAYTGTVNLKLDGADNSSTTFNVKLVPTINTSGATANPTISGTSATNTFASSDLVVGEVYDVYVNGYSIGTIDGATNVVTSNFYTVSVATDGNGSAEIKGPNLTAPDVAGSAGPSVTSTGAAASIVVPAGSTVGISTNPNPYYKLNSWTATGTSTTVNTTTASIAVPAAGTTGGVSLTANFARKTTDLTIKFVENSSGGNDHAITGTVEMEDAAGTVKSDTASNEASVTINGLEQGVAYDIEIGGVSAGSYAPANGDDGFDATYEIIFYSVTLNANTEGYVNFGTAASGTAASAGPNWYLYNQVVDIAAAAKTNYNFTGWEKAVGSNANNGGIDTASSAATKFTVGTGGAAVLNANFSRASYGLGVTVTVNDVAADGLTVKATDGINPDITGTTNSSGVVTLNGLKDNTEYTVSVSGGSYTAIVGTKKVTPTGETDPTMEFKFYTVTLKTDGSTGNTALLDNSYTANDTTDVTVAYLATTSVDVSASATTGYRFDTWTDSNNVLSADNAATGSFNMPTNAVTLEANFVRQFQLTTSVSNTAHGEITAPTNNPVMVDAGTRQELTAAPKTDYRFDHWEVTVGTAKFYDAATGGTDLGATPDDTTVHVELSTDATVKAVFVEDKFDATITTYYNSNPTDMTLVELRETDGITVVATTATPGPGVIAISHTPNSGVYTAAGVVANSSAPTVYDVWVNGYKTTATVQYDADGDTGGNTMKAEVTMYMVTVATNVVYPGTTGAPDTPGTAGTHYEATVKNEANSISADASDADPYIYVPAGTSRKVNLEATLIITDERYRFATSGDGSDLWTTTASGSSLGGMSNTPTNYTIGNLNADVTITANFVYQWKVTAYPDMANDAASMTVGDVTNNTTKTAIDWVKNDTTTRIEVTATAATGKKFSHWVIVSGTGTLYDAQMAGNTLTANASGHYGDSTNSTIWVVPSADMELKAYFVDDDFVAKVPVRYNGAAATTTEVERIEFKDNETGNVVATNGTLAAGQVSAALHTDGYVYATLPAMESNGTTPNSYSLWINGYDTGIDVSKADYDGDNEITDNDNNGSDAEDDTVIGGGAAGADGMGTGVTLYKLTTATHVLNSGATNAGNTAYIKGGTYYTATNLTTMYVPDTADTVTLTASATTGYRLANDAADSGVDQWTDTAGGTTAILTAASGTHSLGSLTDHVTYYANFVQQFTVNVATSTGGARASGTNATNTVDLNDSIAAEAQKATGYAANSLKDSAFVQWAVTAGTGDFGSVGSTNTTTTDNPANYYPTADSTITAQFKTLEFDSAAKANAAGNGSWSGTTVQWAGLQTGYSTTNQTMNVTIKNAGAVDTANLQISLTNGTYFEVTNKTTLESAGVTAGNSVVLNVTIKTGAGAGTVSDTLTISDGAVTIQIPLSLEVGDPSTYIPTLVTHVNTANADNASFTGIESVVLVDTNSSNYYVYQQDTTPGYWKIDGSNSSYPAIPWATTLKVYINGMEVSGVTVDNSHVAVGTPWNIVDLWTVGWSDTSYVDGSSNTMGEPYYKTTTNLATSTGVTGYVVAPSTGSITGTSETATLTSLAIPKDATINVYGNAHDTSTVFYAFDEWADTPATGTFTPSTNEDTTYTVGTGNAVALAPSYQLQYKVTYGGAKDMTNTAVTMGASFDSTALNANGHVMVDAGDGMAIAALTVPTGYKFSHWEITSGSGSWTADGGHASTGADTFTPGADTTLTAVLWKEPTLAANDNGYDIGGGATGANDAPNWTWTLNDATAATSDTIQYKLNSNSDWITLTTNEYTVSGNTYTLKTNFLKTLALGTYDIRFASSLVADNSATFNGGDTTKDSTFTISATGVDLTKVNIKESSADAGHVAVGGSVVYKDHLPTSITASNKLTYTWYKATTAPTQGIFSSVDSGWTSLVTGDTTGSYTVQNTDAGYYIFAVVTASVTGTGSVITNSIPVDYDATVKVKVDNTPITDSTTAANYAVELRLQSGSGNIPATWNDAAGGFITTGSALTGGVSYDVYVREVAGNADLVDSAKDVTPSASTVDAVEYFTVSKTNFSKTDAQDNSGASVGETISPLPGVDSFTTASGKTVNNGVAVLTGTDVTAKSESWGQDYTLTWKQEVDGVATNGASQNSTAASSTTGHTVDVTGVTTIGGELTQNTYTVKFQIHDVTTGGTATPPAAVKSATLKVTVGGDTYTFDGDVEDGNAGSTGTANKYVVFEVPATNTATGKVGNNVGYTMTVVAQDGTDNDYADTTVSDYPADPITVTADATYDTSNDNMDIDIETATYEVLPVDPDTSSTATDNTDEDVELDYGYHKDNQPSGTQNVYYAKFKNTGNTAVDITISEPTDFGNALALDTANSTSGFVWGTARTLAAGETLTIAFTVKDDLHYMDDAFTFEAEVTKVGGDALSSNAAPYTHTFELTVNRTTLDDITVVDADSGNVAVGDTLELTGYTTTPNNIPALVDAGSVADHIELKDVEPIGTDTTDDLDYQWYHVPNTDTTVWDAATLKASSYAIASATNATYTVAPTDHGKTLYLIVSGKGDATGDVLSGGFKVNYDAQVKLEDGSNSNAALGGTNDYKVVLSTSETDVTAGAITLTWDAAGYYKTENGALTPGTDYYIWVYGVEGDTTTMTCVKKLNTTLDTTDYVAKDNTVTYYEVDYTTPATIKNAYTGMQVGTNMYDPSSSVINVTGSVADGKHVVFGTSVTFTGDAIAANHDYSYSWQEDGTDISGTTNTNTVTYDGDKGTISATVTQNTYTVTAYVKGGTATELKLTDAAGNVFTTAASNTGSYIFNATNGVISSVADGQTAEFKVPKGTYSLEHASGAAINGSTGYDYDSNYLYDPSATEGNDPKTGFEVNTTASYGLYLEGASYTLKVSDNVAAANGTHSGTQTSSLDGDTNVQTAGAYKLAVERPYGWTDGTAADIIVVTFANAGNKELYEVDAEMTSNSNSTALDVNLGAFAGNGVVDMTDYTTPASEDITITLRNSNGSSGNLPAGTYTVVITAKFATTDGGNPLTDATLTYTLELKVEAGKLASTTLTNDKTGADAATIGANTETTGNVGDKLIYKDSSTLDNNNVTVPDADLEFKWYSVPHGEVPTFDADGNMTNTDAVLLTDSDSNDQEYTLTDNEAGKDVYLVTYAKTGGSSTGFVQSGRVKVNWTGKVQINVDTVGVNDDSVAGDPGYKVYFRPDNGTADVPATWDGTNDVYYANGLAAGTTYKVLVDTVKGNDAKHDSGLTVNGTTIGTTNQVEVDYFTLTLEAVDTKEDARTDGKWAETFTDYPVLTAKVNNVTVADTDDATTGTNEGTTNVVLKNQSVVVTAPTWGEDYKLEWQETVGSNAVDNSDSDDAASASHTATMTNKVTIDGVMVQKVYTIVGNITGTGTLTTAKITRDSEDLSTDTTVDSVSATLDASNKTVTFKVPAGNYTLNGTAASGSTLRDINVPAIAGEDTTLVTADKDINVDTNPADDTDAFNYHVVTASMGLTVSDNADTAHTATGTVGTPGTALNEYHKFFGYKADQITGNHAEDALTVKLTNTSNTALTISYELQKWNGTAWVAETALPTTVGDITVKNLVSDGSVSGTFDLTAADASSTGDEEEVFTITVPNKLKNDDDVKYRVEFTSKDSNNVAGPTLYYDLDFKVDPLTIESAQAELVGTTAQVKDFDADTDGDSNPDNVKKVTLTDGTNDFEATAVNGGVFEWTMGTGATDDSIGYKWFTIPGDVTVTSDSATVGYDGNGDANSWTVTVNGTQNGANVTVTADPISGANAPQYTLTDAEAGKQLYLLVYATNNETGNVTGWTLVTPPTKLPYYGIIKVEKDDILQTATMGANLIKVTSNSAADWTTVSGDTANLVNTTWSGTDGGYKTNTTLDPAKTYYIWAETYPGSNVYVKVKDETLTNTDREGLVEYFTVEYVPEVEVSNTYATVDSALTSDITYGMSLTVNGDVTALDNTAVTSVTVLKGTKVTASVSTTATNSDSQSWSTKKHYDLEWTVTTTMADGTTSPATSTSAYPTSATTVEKEQTAVTAPIKFTGKLVQKLYTLTIKINEVDNPAVGASVVDATIASVQGGGTPALTISVDGSATDDNVITGDGEHDDTIVFKVPAADDGYVITVVPADGTGGTKDTSVVKYHWDTANATDKMTTGAITANDSTKGVVDIQAANYELVWQNNYVGVNNNNNPNAFVNGSTFNKDSGLVYGVYDDPTYANTDGDYKYTLQLKNTGNKAVEAKLELPSNAANDIWETLTTATIYDAAGNVVGTANAVDLTGNFTIPVGGYAQFTLQIPAGKDAGDYQLDIKVISANLANANGDNYADGMDFTAKYTVHRAKVTALEIVDVVAPKKGATPVDTQTLQNVKTEDEPAGATGVVEVAMGGDGKYVTWKDASGAVIVSPNQFAAGQVYTATVTLMADKNHQFDPGTYKEFYQFLTKNAVDDAEVTVGTPTEITGGANDGKQSITLTYTFPATASGDITITASAGDASNENKHVAGKVTKIEATSNIDLDYYYVVTATDLSTYFAAGGDAAQKVTRAVEIITAANNGTIDGATVLKDTNAHSATASGGTATWTGADVFTGLSNGTEYYVYAVSVPKGTTTGYADVVSEVSSTTFTTSYKVVIKVEDPATGTLDPATLGNGPVYVEPGKSVDINALPTNSGYIFDKWYIDPEDHDNDTYDDGEGSFSADGGSAGTPSANATYTTGAKAEFWPTDNTTIVVAFKAIPILEATGTNITEEYGDSYDGSQTTGYVNTINLYHDGKVTNIGEGKLGGNLAFKVMPQGWTVAGNSLNDSEIDTFKVDVSGYYESDGLTTTGADLIPDAFASIQVWPKAGLDHTGSPYTATIVAYDPNTVDANGDPAVYTTFDITMKIVEGDVLGAPLSLNWDIYKHAPANHGNSTDTALDHDAWKSWYIELTAAAKDINDSLSVEGIKNLGRNVAPTVANGEADYANASLGTMLDPADYEFSNKLSDLTRSLTIKAQYIVDMLENTGAQGGDSYKFVVKFVDSRTSGTTYTYKVFTLNILDTTPYITGVTLNPPPGGAVTGAAITATVTTTTDEDGDATDTTYDNGNEVTKNTWAQADLDAGKIYINWYRVDPDKYNANATYIPAPADWTLVQGYPDDDSDGKLDIPAADTNNANNKISYTLTAADSGKIIVAVAMGDIDYITDGTWVANEAKDARATLASVTTKVVDKAGTTINNTNIGITPDPSDTSYVGDGYDDYVSINAPETANGYIFKGWKIDSGTGTFTNATATAAGTANTYAEDGAARYWATGDSVIVAEYHKLPTLEYTVGTPGFTKTSATYDVGSNPASNNKVPELTYAQNDGSGTVVYVITAAADTFTSDAKGLPGYNGDDNYLVISGVDSTVITEANLKAWLGAGNYTITAYDTVNGQFSAVDATGTTANSSGNALYDVSVDLTITKKDKALPNVSALRDSDKADVNPTEGMTLDAWFGADKDGDFEDEYGNANTNATYQWFYADVNTLTTADLQNVLDGNSTDATVIAGATDKNLTVPAGLEGKYIYVLATGGNEYSGAKSDVTPVVVDSFSIQPGQGTAKYSNNAFKSNTHINANANGASLTFSVETAAWASLPAAAKGLFTGETQYTDGAALLTPGNEKFADYLRFDTATGQFSIDSSKKVDNNVGTYVFLVKVVDNNGLTKYTTYTFTIEKGDLTVNGEGYAGGLAGYDPNVPSTYPAYNTPSDLDDMTYTNVTDMSGGVVDDGKDDGGNPNGKPSEATAGTEGEWKLVDSSGNPVSADHKYTGGSTGEDFKWIFTPADPNFNPVEVPVTVKTQAPQYGVTIRDNNTLVDGNNTRDNFGTYYKNGVNPSFVTENVTITNTGDPQKVTVTFGGNWDYFTISGVTNGQELNMTASGTKPLTVTPNMAKLDTNNDGKIDLAPGTYTGTITATGANGGSETYTFTFTIRELGVSNISTTVTDGTLPDGTGTVIGGTWPGGTPDGTGDIDWKDEDGTPVDDSNKPTAGGKYTVEVTIKPEGDPLPPSMTPQEFIDTYGPTWSGTPITDPDEITINPDGTVTITKGPYTAGGGGGGGGAPTPTCPHPVHYWLGNNGVTEDPTIEEVDDKKTPDQVPTVKPLGNYKFLGWSLTDPATLKAGQTAELVDPTTVKITEETIFYAVYEEQGVEHGHYVIGYPNGTFGPADSITRGSVATIIARACLDGFVEGYNYGNPGGYTDVEGHWAYSAISYCTMYNVFTGYEDDTFRPDQPITRQELAMVIARLAGVQSNQGMPFSDSGDIADWAVDGVYTVYANGWVEGYLDGTFKPLNNIRRDETVKIFNGYLNRGVDADGLSGLVEYVHSGTASNNTEDGVKEYMTWPDVPKGHWAYYEIIEAANDHAFDWHDEANPEPPEHWTLVWINEVWRYHDDANDGGPQS